HRRRQRPAARGGHGLQRRAGHLHRRALGSADRGHRRGDRRGRRTAELAPARARRARLMTASGSGGTPAVPGLEPLDKAIVAELSADGRRSFTDLAERVGLSVSAVHQRVRRLEQRGVIRGYTAKLDGEQIGLPLTALISLTPNDPAAPDDYPQRLEHIPEIESCYSVAGDESYILLVREIGR